MLERAAWWLRSFPDSFRPNLEFPSQARAVESSSYFSMAWKHEGELAPSARPFQPDTPRRRLDARGYGESDDYEGELVFERDFVSDLLSVMDLLAAGSAHLVGLSMGGIIAQCFYFAHPDRVRSLVLADSFPSFQVIGAAAVKGFLAARVDPLLEGATPADLASAAAKAMLAPARPRVRASYCWPVCRIYGPSLT